MNQEWNVPGTTKEPYSTEKAWEINLDGENSEVVYWRSLAKSLRNKVKTLKERIKELERYQNIELP